MFVTQRQLAETIAGIQSIAQDLRGATDVEPIPDTRGRIVPASAEGLKSHAEFLERAARELLNLIDDDVPIEVPKT
jgi:hypothetical protein